MFNVILLALQRIVRGGERVTLELWTSSPWTFWTARHETNRTATSKAEPSRRSVGSHQAKTVHTARRIETFVWQNFHQRPCLNNHNIPHRRLKQWLPSLPNAVILQLMDRAAWQHAVLGLGRLSGWFQCNRGKRQPTFFTADIMCEGPFCPVCTPKSSNLRWILGHCSHEI